MMGFLNNIMGNATELSMEEIAENFGKVIFEGEQPHKAFRIFRDKWLFTNKRLIMLNVQGVTGSKKEYHTIPYKSIYHFSVETAGTFDTDCELKLWIAGSDEPLKQELKKGVDVIELQRMLGYFVCGGH